MRETFATKKIGDGLLKIGIIASIATALIIVCSANKIAPAYAAADGQPIAGIQCERQEYGNFHIHAHLDIFIDGKPHAVPESIGIIDRRCLYWMHTHDPSGIIHIEAPETRAFTLAQFLEIWRATAPGAPPAKQKPKVFIDGKKAEGEWERVEIADLTEIAVVYGKDPPEIPSHYVFPLEYRKGPFRRPS